VGGTTQAEEASYARLEAGEKVLAAGSGTNLAGLLVGLMIDDISVCWVGDPKNLYWIKPD
jgi:hypothetical protein